MAMLAPSAAAAPRHGPHPHQQGVAAFVPDIFLLGEQKAGSSALFTLLTKHAGICGGKLKEPHRFDNLVDDANGLHTTMSAAEYQQLYSQCRPDQRTLDATPNYVLDQSRHHPPSANSSRRNGSVGAMDMIRAEQLKAGAADPVFIVVVREPVSRLLSWYNHQKYFHRFTQREFCPTASFEGYATCKNVWLLNYRIGAVLQGIQRVWDPKQLLILTMKMLLESPKVAMAAIARHLAVPMPPAWMVKTMPSANIQPHKGKVHLTDLKPSFVCMLYANFREDQKLLETAATKGPTYQPPFELDTPHPNCANVGPA